MIEQVEVKIKDIIEMLDDGKTRKEIAIHYKMPLATLNGFFKNEKLVGKRTKKQTGFILVDDTRKYLVPTEGELFPETQIESDVPVTALTNTEEKESEEEPQTNSPEAEAEG